MRSIAIALWLIVFSSWLSTCSSTCIDRVLCEHRTPFNSCPNVDNTPQTEQRLNYSLLDDDDDDRGLYQFNFSSPVYECRFIGYQVDLFFFELPKNECNNSIENYPSEYVYTERLDDKQIMEIGQNCSNVHIVSCFDSLYSGCYKIEIKQLKTSPPEYFEHIFWLENKYVYDNFSIKTPMMDTDNKESYVYFYASFDEDYLAESKNKFSVKLSNNNNIVDVTNSCNNKRKKFIHCEFYKLEPGAIYNVTVYIKHPKCTSIYGVCSWKYDFVTKNVTIPSGLTHENLVSLKWYEEYLVMILIFITFIVSLAGWIVYKKKTSQKTAQQTYDNVLCKGVDCHVPEIEKVTGIYLIYARDCPTFMKVMEVFRKLLKKMTNCEVYDMFDSALFNEIAMSPNEWVMSHLQDPNIRVVLVATECADRLYEKILHYYTNNSNPDEHYRNLYLRPDFSDTYVSHSLKLITFDINSTPYHKFFVVRFPKFNKKKDYLTHINPFKRFDMPENIDVLINNIFHQAPEIINNEDVDSKSLCEAYDENAFITKEYFHQCVEELNDFFKEYPNYLMEKILIDQTDVGRSEDSSFLSHSRNVV